jgi:purine-binding chemotaxis protein CheW
MAEMNGHHAAAQEQPDIGRRLAGKYLMFQLGAEEYGIQILKVQEIIQMQRVTKVPKAPPFVRGVINLRGKVIPVIELRAKFGMDIMVDNEKTCIIVVRIMVENTTTIMGIIIDEVREVLDMPADSIEETPALGTGADSGFVMGIGKVGANVKMLLDIEMVLSAEELTTLVRMGQTT